MSTYLQDNFLEVELLGQNVRAALIPTAELSSMEVIPIYTPSNTIRMPAFPSFHQKNVLFQSFYICHKTVRLTWTLWCQYSHLLANVAAEINRNVLLHSHCSADKWTCGIQDPLRQRLPNSGFFPILCGNWLPCRFQLQCPKLQSLSACSAQQVLRSLLPGQEIALQ